MAKFAGRIGFAHHDETAPGVFTEEVDERVYYGDILKNTNQWVSTENLNDDVIVRNQVSIVADPYAFDNFFAIRYVVWLGKPWKVTNVEIESPRLILTMGGLYNGKTAETT